MGSSTKRSKSSPSKTSKSSKKKKQTSSSSTSLNNNSNASPSGTTIKSPPQQQPQQGPIRIVIVDSGGWNLKHGSVVLKKEKSSSSSSTSTSAPQIPRIIPNYTAKLRHQLATLVGDEIHTVNNKAQLDVTFPLERGYCTDLGCQLSVWTRVLEHEGVTIGSSAAAAAAVAVGTTPSKKKKTNAAVAVSVSAAAASGIPSPSSLSLNSCVFVLTQPFTPTVLSERVDEVLFSDLEFGRVAKRLGQCCAAYRYIGAGREKQEQEEKEDEGCIDGTNCCLVVDSGFSLTHVVPTVNASAVQKAIRRINIGGKFLTNLLKESISYRQWNMMDEFFLMNDVKEKLCFISTYFEKEMKAAALEKHCRWFDREFVLPDFAERFEGVVRIPERLRMMEQMMVDVVVAKEEKGEKEGKEKNEKDTVEETTKMEEENTQENENDDGGEEDSEEESEEKRCVRIQQMKEEERRRKELEEAERQVLSLSVERFAVPEVLFRPSDVGLEQAGIAEVIAQAIEACDLSLRAAMYQNIVLIGGNAKIPFFKERLEMELRTLAPSNYEVRIVLPEDPIGYAWKGANEMAKNEGFLEQCCVSKIEWEASRKKNSEKDIWADVYGNDADQGLTVT